jgi:cytidine deaminase
MKKQFTIINQYDVYDNVDELSESERELIIVAKQVGLNAYAPYSHFFVGAAVLLENGIIVSGNNQENAAYPSGLCAERVAIFYASSQYPNQKILALAISAHSPHRLIDKPVAPCGSCRQAIAEYEFKFKHPIEILMMGEKGQIYKSASISNLLPLLFNKTDLHPDTEA